MTWVVALNVITSIVSAFLGYIILFRSKQKSSVQFSILALAAAIWIWTNIIFLLTDNLFWLRAAYGTGVLLPMIATYWADTFGSADNIFDFRSKNKIRIISGLSILTIGLAFFVLSLFTKLVVANLVDNQLQSGILFNLYALVLFAFMAFSIIRLSLRLRSLEGEKKDQAKIVLLGYTSFGLAAVIIDVILPLLGYPEIALLGLDSTSAIFLVIAAAYAITKHGLFGVKVIITELVAGSLVLINLIQVLTSKSVVEAVPKIFILVFVSFFAYILVKSVQAEIDKRQEVEKLAREKLETLNELQERNKNLSGLQRISSVVLNEIEMRPMVQKILDQIPEQLKHCIGALLILKKKDSLTPFAMSRMRFNDKINQLVGEALEKYDLPISKGTNLVHNAFVDKKIQMSASLTECICPPINKTVGVMLEKTIGAKFNIAIPMHSTEEELGVLLFTFDSPQTDIDNEEMDMIDTIATEMSLAIQRAVAFQKLKDANEYLSQMDKMKDEFISVASHELNTPLAAIEGYLSMILDENMGKIDAKSKEYLDRAYASSKRLASLVMDLLNVSRIEQGRIILKFTEANMYDLAESVVHELQVRADAKKVYLKLEGDKAKIPTTWCDTDRIREVIVNLAGNAIKFTKDGGVTIKVTDGNGKIRCEVADTGRGISELDKSKLFQKFSQINRDVDQQQGTGLGLYISKNYIELHKGKIWVESTPEKGSHFIFEIPVMKSAPKDTVEAKLTSGAANTQPVQSPQISTAPKGVPAAITDSVKTE